MAPAKKIHKCSVCKLAIENSTCILCEICNLWVHNKCAGLSEDDISSINKLPKVSFICSVCKTSLPSCGPRNEITNLGKKFDVLCDKLNAFIVKSGEDNSRISSKLDMAVADIKAELSNSVNKLKSEIDECKDFAREVEVKANNRLDLLEAENNTLYRRLYSNDIIINGLPDCIKDLSSMVINLAQVYNVGLTSHDINHAIYIKKKRSVLVKFNSLSLRNAIMVNYYKNLKTKPLLAADFVTGVPSDLLNQRIYLNDHYSPVASELNSACLKLLKKGLIKRFRLLNTVKPVAVAIMRNDEEMKLDCKGCAELLRAGGDNVPANT